MESLEPRFCILCRKDLTTTVAVVAGAESFTCTGCTNGFRFAGTISEGTHKANDLFSAFYPVLLEMDPIVAQEIAFHDHDEIDEVIVEIMYLLDNLAPEGYFFGSHDGDGACFGFWKEDDEELLD